MAVIPCVVVHQCGPVGHPGYLIAVIPPRHHTGILMGVLTQPKIGLSEVIQYVPTPVDEEQRRDLSPVHVCSYVCERVYLYNTKL